MAPKPHENSTITPFPDIASGKGPSRPSINEPGLPIQELRLAAHLPEAAAGARRIGAALFDKTNRDVSIFFGQKDVLESEKALLNKLLATRGQELCRTRPLEQHITGEAAYEEPKGSQLKGWLLNGASAAAVVSLSWMAANWVLASELFENVNTMASALLVSGVAVSAGVGLPLVGYYRLGDDDAKSAFMTRTIRVGGGLLGGWLLSFAIAAGLDGFVTDFAGHAGGGVLLTAASIVRNVAVAGSLVFQLGAEMAAGVGLKVAASEFRQRHRKKIALKSPVMPELEKLVRGYSARLTEIAETLANIAALEAALNDGREAFALKCEAAVCEFQSRQNHAASAARLRTSKPRT